MAPATLFTGMVCSTIFPGPCTTVLKMPSPPKRAFFTPGTVTIDVRENSSFFVVHALTDHAAEGLLEGTMQRKIGKLFGEDVTIDFVSKGVCA